VQALVLAKYAIRLLKPENLINVLHIDPIFKGKKHNSQIWGVPYEFGHFLTLWFNIPRQLLPVLAGTQFSLVPYQRYLIT